MTRPALPDVIETRRLMLRPWRLDDVDDVRMSRIERGKAIDEAWFAILRSEWEG